MRLEGEGEISNKKGGTLFDSFATQFLLEIYLCGKNINKSSNIDQAHLQHTCTIKYRFYSSPNRGMRIHIKNY